MAASRNSTSNMAAESAPDPTPPASGQAVSLPDDADLLRRAGHGEGGAFRELVNRHGRYLFGVARLLAGNRSYDADDLLQETYVAALAAAGRFRGDASVKTWLVSILVRQAALLRRKVQRFPRLASKEAISQGGMNASNAGTASDAKLDLARMLEALSPEHRQVIVLRELQRMSYEEIAEALGVPRGTVESRLFRAREDLRKKFKGYL